MAIEVQSEPIDVPSEPMLSIAAPAPIEPEPPAVPPANAAHDALIIAARAAAPAASVEHVEQSAPPAASVEHVEQPHVAPVKDDPLAAAREARDKIMARLQGKATAPPKHPMAMQTAPRASFRDDIDPIEGKIEGKIEGIGAGGPPRAFGVS
jgi:hypothetical protein